MSLLRERPSRPAFADRLRRGMRTWFFMFSKLGSDRKTPASKEVAGRTVLEYS